jgi:hypothetical protein
MKGCLRYGLILLIGLIIGLIIALGVMTLQQQGLLNWLNAPLQNRATVILERIQQMSVLTTTRYNFSSIVTSEREMPPLLAGLYGERQVLVAVGYVTAGIDLSRMTEQDITTQDGVMTIRLPAPTLQDCILDEGASYIAERDTGIFNRSAPDLDVQARQYAIEQFRDQSLNQNILGEVQGQAQVAISEFVTLLNIPGVTTVSVETASPDPNAPIPPSCQ